MKKYLFLFICLGLLFISGCKDEQQNDEPPHECVEGTWVFPEGTKCLEEVLATKECNECGAAMEIAVMKKKHNMAIEEKEETCCEDGYYKEYCTDCDYDYTITYPKTEVHEYK